jgi:hypothetical protein
MEIICGKPPWKLGVDDANYVASLCTRVYGFQIRRNVLQWNMMFCCKCFFLLRKIGYESMNYALCHVIFWQALLFPLAKCYNCLVWGIIFDKIGHKICIYTCTVQLIKYMLALKEIQHLLQGEKLIRTFLVKGFVCNC